MLSEEQIITGCMKNSRKAQKALYDKYASTMFAICLRYGSNRAEAEDMLQDGFVKIFLNISQYSGKGSFEGWIKRIIINNAISVHRKNLKHYYHQPFDDVNENDIVEEEDLIEDELTYDELFSLINELPEGYKMVFNLHVIEGFKHKEIAEMLNIDQGTSKSQFSRARAFLKNKIKELKKNFEYIKD